ncbi:hypothetical protein EKE94_07695 [Mesobaculum littorinae]|uniref:Tetratricopeptide repeat-like domain-containing protein n=1 Tax=Mesobaculum littorinae TaxID=2486419 RepID=A0A438AJE6_9RHOB|nr:hypothetical protein [Mesobaculum littorinae]RVV98774.1 hypothetical protein EKE94_07695 [Mesobaculum littorinae]
MSNSDSFFEEVSDEVRRDRLFGLIRRYGWIAIALVIVLVVAAAIYEWREAQRQAAAQDLGDAILAANEAGTPEARREALADLQTEGTPAAVVALLRADDAADADTRAAAQQALDDVAANGAIPAVYRQLATLKRVMISPDMAPDERIRMLDPLAEAGAPFRLLAGEQIALAEIEAGDRDAALDRAQDLLRQDGMTSALQQRLQQLIVALGGTLDAA